MSETLIIDENKLFAPVRIAQTDGYAHIDTGARCSSVLQSYSKQFPEIEEREIRGALAAATVTRVSLDEITFLGGTFPNLTADVQPDSQGGLDTLPFPVTMALGCDVLLQKPLYLNFEQGKIAHLQSNLPTKSHTQLEADFSLGVPIFKVSLGKHMFNALFDTGGGLSVLDQRLLAKFEKELTEDEPVAVEDATGAKHKIPTFKCSSLRIGDQLLEERQFLILDLGAIEQESGRRVDCVFGLNTMVEKSWIIDSARQQIEIL